MAEKLDYIRRPPAVPIVHPHAFPVIPPAPFGLTDDLFSALHLRPLFLEHVGNPDLPSTEKQEAEGGNIDEAGGSKPGESSADKLPKKREWKRPPRAYDSLLGGLPDPRPLPGKTEQLTLLLHTSVPPPAIPDPPGFIRQDIKSAGFRFEPILDPKSMTDIGVVTLKEGKVRGVNDVYTNGQKNPRRAKGGPPGGDPNRNRRKKENQKASHFPGLAVFLRHPRLNFLFLFTSPCSTTQARNEYHARNRQTAPGQLENTSGYAYDLAVGSPRTPGTPGTPRSRPGTPGYRAGSRVGTPGYVRQQ